MLKRSEHQVSTTRGRVGVYLGDCGIGDVLDAHERFGAVTLQGRRGLDHVRLLRHLGHGIEGIDVDPATYLKAPKARRDDELVVVERNWIAEQRTLGLTTIRTAAQRLRVGRLDELRQALDVDVPADVTVTLALDGGWLGKRHIAELEQQLKLAHRSVALVLGAVYDPVDTVDKVRALRRLVAWATAEHLRFELLRTDLVGLPAALDGLAYAAVGLTTSTRHLAIPMKNGHKSGYVRRQHSPLVFVPQLMHWLRGERIGVLGHWDGVGVTDCDCGVCATEGSLLRFDHDFARSKDAKAFAAPHNSEAMRRTITEVLSSDDPAAELRRRRETAIRLAREIRDRQRVEIELPAWIERWT